MIPSTSSSADPHVPGAGIRPRSRLLDALLALLILAAIAAPALSQFAAPRDEARWSARETARLAREGDAAARQLGALIDELSSALGRAADSLGLSSDAMRPLDPRFAFETVAGAASAAESAGEGALRDREWGILVEESGRDLAWWGRPRIPTGAGPRSGAFLDAGRVSTVIGVAQAAGWNRRLVASARVDGARTDADAARGGSATLRFYGADATPPPAERRPSAIVPIDVEARRIGSIVLEGETFAGARQRARAAGGTARFVLAAAAVAIAALRLVATGRVRAMPAGARHLLALAVAIGGRTLLALARPGPNAPGAAFFEPHSFAAQAPLGLLRSPGDLFLTVLAAALAVRVVDRASREAGEAGRRTPLLATLTVFAMTPLAALFGARAAAAIIYASGPRLFDTALPDLSPVAILLTFSLALAGFTLFRLLLAGVRSGGVAARPLLLLPLVALAGLAVWAAPGGLAAGVAVPAIGGALAAATWLARIEGRGGVTAIDRGALFLLGAGLVLLPGIDAGLEARDRDRIHEVAARFTTPRDEWRRFVLEETLEFFAAREQIVDALARGGADRLENLAFAEWLDSPLASLGYECALDILDASGAVVSRFSIGLPPESGHEATFAFRDARRTKRAVIRAGQRKVGGDVLDAYLGALPLMDERGEVAGAVVVTIPYFFENLAYATRPAAARRLLLGSEAEAEIAEPIGALERLVVSRFEEGRLVASSDPSIAPGLVLPEAVAATPPGTFIRTSLYRGREITLLAPLRARSIDAAGAGAEPTSPGGRDLLALTLRRSSAGDLLKRLVHVVLVAACLLAIRSLAVVLYGAARGRPYLASFREKLLAAFLVIAVIPALLMGVLTQRETTRRVTEASQREAADGLEAVRGHLQERSVAEATRLSQSTLIRRLALGLETLASIDLETGLKKFSLFAPSGELLLQNGVVPDVARDRIRAVASTLRPLTFFSPEDELSVVSAVPVIFEGADEPGKGVLLLRTPLDADLASALGEEGNRDLVFYGRSGVAATNRPELFQSELLSRRMPAAAYVDCFIHRKEVASGTGVVGGRKTVVAYGTLAGQDGDAAGALAVPLLYRQREIDSTLSGALTSILYATVLVLVCVAALASVLAQQIARPVAALSSGTKRVARGDLSFSLSRTTGGELGALVDSFNSMTAELLRARDRILERTRTIEAILGNITTGVLALDRDGKIVTLNRGGARILGVSEEAAVGRPAEWLRDGVRDEVADTLAAIGSAPDGVLEREIALPRVGLSIGPRPAARDAQAAPSDGGAGAAPAEPGVGPILSIRAVGTRLLNQSGEELGRVLVFEDLTELIRSKKLLAWSEMARQVAHEIKNPLTPMKLSAQHMRRAYDDRAPEFGRILEEGTEAIIAEIESLRRIATEFSSFARMPRRVTRDEDLNDIVRESVRFYRSAGSAPLDLALDAAAPRAQVDREEMKRVFVNVVENAVQASRPGSRVHVRTLSGSAAAEAAAGGAEHTVPPAPGGSPNGFVEWSGRPPDTGALAVVVVEDQGSGIPSEMRGRLFQPYFSTKTEGTGLGLAICKGIVEEHGGAIRVASRAEGGTSVMIVLPAATPRESVA